MSYDEMQGTSEGAGPSSPLNGYHRSYDKKYLANLPPTPKKQGGGRPKSREEPMMMPIPEDLISDEDMVRLKRDTKHLSFPLVLEILHDRAYNVDDTINYCKDKVVPNMVCPISEQLIAASSYGLKRKKMSTVINHNPLYHRFFLKKFFKEETNHLVEFYQNNKKKLPVLIGPQHTKYADPDQVEYLRVQNAQYIIDCADQRKKNREVNRIARLEALAKKQRDGILPKLPKKKNVFATPIDRPRRCKPKVDFYSPEPVITKHGNAILTKTPPKQPPIIMPKARVVLPPTQPTLPPPKQSFMKPKPQDVLPSNPPTPLPRKQPVIVPKPRTVLPTVPPSAKPKIVVQPSSSLQARRKKILTPPAEPNNQSVMPAMSEQKISTRNNSVVEHTFNVTKNDYQFETTSTSIAFTPFLTVRKSIGSKENNVPSTSTPTNDMTKENESARESTRASSTASSTSSSTKRVTRSSNSDDLFTTGLDVMKRKKRDYERTFNGMFWKKGAPPPTLPAKKRKINKPEKKTEDKKDGKVKKRKARKRIFGTHKHQYEKRRAFLYMKQMKEEGIPTVSGALIPVIDLANQPSTSSKPKTRSVRVNPTPVKQRPRINSPSPTPSPPSPLPRRPPSPSPDRDPNEPRRVPTPEGHLGNKYVHFGIDLEDEFGNRMARTPTPTPPPPSPPPLFQEGRPRRIIQPKIFFGMRVEKRTQSYV
ncbi:unnamed protein product [Caenorhabditis angaria]|uniref:Uncharacterized protein n=1 Tax=Caenorhabditis angaria TaxID=860376 RepID=A0A9P1NC43_9PELO|nr:unnamed protein product [Caenorhabditis angaria]